MGDFGRVNQIYSEYFKTHAPARVCIGVSELPKNAKF
jgi:2-iminobutanoate/2-iminopropanoate deaminase